MEISLHLFEQQIDETILKRGLQYFKKGYVNEPEEMSPGKYDAIVEGSESYTVRISIENDTITDYVCSCPYEMGPVCKHVVALIFYLQQDSLNLTSVPKKTETKRSAKKKTVEEQVNEILGKISHDDLKAYIKEQCDMDTSFRRLFLANFSHLVMPDSQALYAQQIKAILKTTADRHGYLGYNETRHAGITVYELVQRAEKKVETANCQTAMYMACAVLEEMYKALEYADDSNGDIGSCIDGAITVLSSLSSKQIPENIRHELFNYCLELFRVGKFKDFDWHFSILNIATDLCQTSDEGVLIHALLDEVKQDDSGWNLRNAQDIRLQLIQKFEGAEKASEFIYQNLSNSDFRKLAIESALSKKDYFKATVLAEDGIKIDEKDKPGLVDNWRQFLLKIYTLQNDADNIRKYARLLFLNSNRDKKSYYDILKNHVLPQNWNEYVQGLITNITQGKRWDNYALIAQIHIWEEQWSDLLVIVKRNATLNNLEVYDNYLAKDYAEDITTLYQSAILEYMENNVSRDHYQQACRYLRRMIKMGARAKANDVIVQLKTLYPRRKALMEELQKV